MQLHKRELALQKARGLYGMAWCETVDDFEVQTYEDANYVAIQLDSFWVEASRKQLSMASSIEAWDSFDTKKFDLGDAVRSAGDKLVHIILERDLTHAEVNSILTSARSSDAKYQLRVDRHPNNPDEPSGYLDVHNKGCLW